MAVPAHVSNVRHSVPRTVATLPLPRVRNEPPPLSLPQSTRFFFFLALAETRARS